MIPSLPSIPPLANIAKGVMGALLALFGGGILWSLINNLFHLDIFRTGLGMSGPVAYAWGLVTLSPTIAGAVLVHARQRNNNLRRAAMRHLCGVSTTTSRTIHMVSNTAQPRTVKL